MFSYYRHGSNSMLVSYFYTENHTEAAGKVKGTEKLLLYTSKKRSLSWGLKHVTCGLCLTSRGGEQRCRPDGRGCGGAIATEP